MGVGGDVGGRGLLINIASVRSGFAEYQLHPAS